MGKLELAVFDVDVSDPPNLSQAKILERALQAFGASVRLNPNGFEAYRGRGDALVRKAGLSVILAQNVAPRPANPGGRNVVHDPESEIRSALLSEALVSIKRAIELANNRDRQTLEVQANLNVAIAEVLHEGSIPNQPVATITPEVRARLIAKQSLLALAADLEKTAATYSESLEDIERCLESAGKSTKEADLFANYLFGRADPTRPAQADAVATSQSLKQLYDDVPVWNRHGIHPPGKDLFDSAREYTAGKKSPEGQLRLQNSYSNLVASNAQPGRRAESVQEPPEDKLEREQGERTDRRTSKASERRQLIRGPFNPHLRRPGPSIRLCSSWRSSCLKEWRGSPGSQNVLLQVERQQQRSRRGAGGRRIILVFQNVRAELFVDVLQLVRQSLLLR